MNGRGHVGTGLGHEDHDALGQGEQYGVKG